MNVIQVVNIPTRRYTYKATGSTKGVFLGTIKWKCQDLVNETIKYQVDVANLDQHGFNVSIRKPEGQKFLKFNVKFTVADVLSLHASAHGDNANLNIYEFPHYDNDDLNSICAVKGVSYAGVNFSGAMSDDNNVNAPVHDILYEFAHRNEDVPLELNVKVNDHLSYSVRLSPVTVRSETHVFPGIKMVTRHYVLNDGAASVMRLFQIPIEGVPISTIRQ